MLLFLLSDHFRELPDKAPTIVVQFRSDARALLGAGLFLAVWCVLRLLAASDEGMSFDVALAVACLCLGVGTALHCVRSLWQ
jgi:hypothetical protein